MPNNEKTYPHYFKLLPKFTTHVDVYMVLRLFGVTDPCVAHAIKKLLCCGTRGAKTRMTDMKEAIASLQRSLEIDAEEDASANQDPLQQPDFDIIQAISAKDTGMVAAADLLAAMVRTDDGIPGTPGLPGEGYLANHHPVGDFF